MCVRTDRWPRCSSSICLSLFLSGSYRPRIRRDDNRHPESARGGIPQTHCQREQHNETLALMYKI